jgi:WD40 repeat protein
VRVWRASDLQLVRVLRGHRGSVLCLLAVGNMLLSGSRDNTIRCGYITGSRDGVMHAG